MPQPFYPRAQAMSQAPRPQQPQPAPQAQGLPDIFENVVIQALMQALQGPQPQMPQPPQPQGLPWHAAAAAAMNPQAAGAIAQKYQAPQAMQYESQMKAFEDAMAGRRSALTAASGLMGRDITGQYGMARAGMSGNRRLRISPRTKVGPEGEGRTVYDIFDPMTGQYLGESDTGEAFVPPVVMPGTVGGEEQTTLVSRSGGGRGTGAPIEAPGGGPLRPKPNRPQVEQINDISNVLTKIDAIVQNPLVGEAGIGEFSARVGQQIVRAVPGVGPSISGRMRPDVENLSRDLDDVRSRVQLILTGKVVNQYEMKRLLGLIPSAADATTPEVFSHNMQRFQQEFTATLTRQARLRPDLFTPEELASLGIGGGEIAGQESGVPTVDSILNRYKEEYGGANPAP